MACILLATAGGDSLLVSIFQGTKYIGTFIIPPLGPWETFNDAEENPKIDTFRAICF